MAGGFEVMIRQCKTCIYHPNWRGTPVEMLEDQVRDKYIGFARFRACHSQPHGKKACCRGFWNRHKDEFAAGQIAQRLKLVRFVEPD